MSTALLVIDVQRALCEGAERAFEIDAVIARINALSAQARGAGVPVVFVQHEEAEVPWKRGCAGWQLAAGLDVAAQDLRVHKATPDAFNQTDLQAQLEGLGVTRLLVCGLQTEFCVDTTVRQALSRGYDVTLIADAHSTLGNAVLSAAQIIAHHNWTFAHMTSFGPRIRVV